MSKSRYRMHQRDRRQPWRPPPRQLRIAGLGLVSAFVIGALLQLPASPFARHGYPERPTMTAAGREQPAAPGGRRTAKPTAPVTASAPTGPVVTYPERGTVSMSVLPGDPEVIGTAGRLFTYQIGIEGGIKGLDSAALARFVRDTYGAPQGWAAGGRWRFKHVGPGQPAPVMQQQTLGLHGCVAYAWPYRSHQRYEGKLGKYDDPLPTG